MVDLAAVLTKGNDLRDWIVGQGATGADVRDLLDRTAAGPAHDPDIADALRAERVRRQARRAVDSEEQMADWQEPPSHLHMGLELDLDEQPLDWAVENLHERGTNTLLVAGYKTGKTVLALNLAKSLVDNEDFLGFKAALADEDCRVAWWNYELTEPQARRWVRDLKVEHPERLAHLPLRGYRMPLQSEEIVSWAVRWLRDRDVKTWILDPFGEAFDGDENDNSVVRVWLQNLNRIKRQAAVDDVFLVAHTGHAEAEEGRERARGASKLEGWKDVGWYYTKHPDSENLRFLRAFGRDVDQANFAVSMEPLTRRLSRDEAAAGLSRNEVVAQQKAQLVAQVVAAHAGLQETPPLGITKTALRRKLGRGGNAEKDEWIDLAIQKGLIRTDKGKQRAIHHYPAAQTKFNINEVPDD